MTGDRRAVADEVGRSLGVDRVYAECTPSGKVDVVRALRAEPGLQPIVMIGDGINDAPALALADVGIAMGAAGATVASETADAVILVDEVDRVGDAVRIGRRSLGIARQSVLVGMLLSTVAMGFAAAGLITPVAGALLQEGIDVAVILNALGPSAGKGRRRPRSSPHRDCAVPRMALGARRGRLEPMQTGSQEERVMKKFFEMGGVIAGSLLVVFAIGAIAMGVVGRHEVRQNIAREAIVGTPDMTPSAIKGEVEKAGLKNITLPTCNVANEAINTGPEAKCFADYMRIHTLEATGGLTYSQMGRYLDKAGKPTNDGAAAAVDPKTQRPVENLARNIWVTETALTTALNTSFFAERVALFSIVVGVALLLTGIGFLVLAYLGVLKARESVARRVTVPTT